MKRSVLVGGLALAAALGFAVSASAIPSLPSPAGLDDGVWVVSDAGPSPTVVAYLSYSETTDFFSALQAFNAPVGFVSGIVTLTDPPSQGAGLSDQFAMVANAGHVDIYFLSDHASPSETATFNAATAGQPVLGNLTETGVWQDVSAFYGEPIYFANIQSSVPEAGSWALMLLGFGVLGATMRRRRIALAARA